MYKWFLAWRYLHTKLIAIFGILAVAGCVAMVLVELSVMGGFLDMIRSRSRGLHSEIVLESGSLQGFPFYNEFADYLYKKMPKQVKLCTPAIYTYGILRVPANDLTKPVRIVGIKLDEYVQVNEFGQGLYYNRYYPGTTHLGEQGMPLAGFGIDSELHLPDEYEKANQKWQAEETDKKELEAYREEPFELAVPHDLTGMTRHREDCLSSRLAERVYKITPYGPPGWEGPEFPGVIIGCEMLHARNSTGKFDRALARGALLSLTILPVTNEGNLTGQPPDRLAVRYADDSNTGVFEIDSMHAYVDFDLLQKRLGMGPLELVEGGFTRPRASQLLIGLRDGVDMNKAWEQIELAWAEFLGTLDEETSDTEWRALAHAKVYTWEQLQAPFIQAVEKEKILITILFSMMSLVSTLLIGLVFYMIVEKKTRDIGVLKSLGASPAGIAGIFIVYAGAVGVVGALLGTLLGGVFVAHINEIQDFLASIHPELKVWSPEVYSFDRIPDRVKPWDATFIAAAAVLSSMIGSVIPAIIAGRVWPVKALRYE